MVCGHCAHRSHTPHGTVCVVCLSADACCVCMIFTCGDCTALCWMPDGRAELGALVHMSHHPSVVVCCLALLLLCEVSRMCGMCRLSFEWYVLKVSGCAFCCCGYACVFSCYGTACACVCVCVCGALHRMATRRCIGRLQWIAKRCSHS